MLVLDDNNLPLHWQGILVDVTKQKLVEEQITTSEAQYHMVVEHASDGIFIVDLSGKIYEANQQTCTLLGFTKDELLNFNLDDLFADKEMQTWNKNESISLDTKKIIGNELCFIQKSNRI